MHYKISRFSTCTSVAGEVALKEASDAHRYIPITSIPPIIILDTFKFHKLNEYHASKTSHWGPNHVQKYLARVLGDPIPIDNNGRGRFVRALTTLRSPLLLLATAAALGSEGARGASAIGGRRGDQRVDESSLRIRA